MVKLGLQAKSSSQPVHLPGAQPLHVRRPLTCKKQTYCKKVSVRELTIGPSDLFCHGEVIEL